MPIKHGVYVYEQATQIGTPVAAATGIPFVIGTAPLQAATNPAGVGGPVACTSFDDAKAKLGYNDDWSKYSLCEFMYSHFILFGCQPVIFVNLLDPGTMKEAVSAADLSVANHKVELPFEAIADDTLVVKVEGGGGDAYVKGTDYDVYYTNDKCVIELLADGAHYADAKLNVAYNKVTPTSVNAAAVATGLEAIERCMAAVGIVPDIICAPGFSHDASVAAAMATKAAGINGMFRAKALIDVSTSVADDYSEVAAEKASKNYVDENQIVCWPKLKLGGRSFFMSTQLAGLMASVDTANGGIPYESPSNKAFKADALVLSSGAEVLLTHAQATALNGAGVVTGLNFTGGLRCWGNYTACYPASTDVKDYLIPVSRMFDFVGNSLINTFWSRLDKPMNRRLIDSIIDTCNIWLNGLVGPGYLLGARVEFKDDENPTDALMSGIIKAHIYMTPPSPAQEIDFVLEYHVDFVAAALQG